MGQQNFRRTLAYHAGVYGFLLILFSFFPRIIVSDYITDQQLFQIRVLLGALLGAHVLIGLKRFVPQSPVVVLFLADPVIGLLLVRLSGGSSSPFLVLFPLIALSAVVAFRRKSAILIVAVLLVFQGWAVGFIPSLIGNSAATLLISALGFYLVRALSGSESMLRASEISRRRLENLQKAILANIPSGLMSVDSEGRIIQVNNVGVKILGLSEQELVSTPLRLHLPDIAGDVTRLSTLVPQMGSMDSALRPRDRPSLKYRRKSGELMQLGYSVARLSDPIDGGIIGSLVVFQDLTDVIKMEDNLRVSEKLAAVGKLAGSIAHEIRNPLASISGSAQLLEETTGMNFEDKRLLRIIQRESSRLDVLITDFLDYVRPQNPKMESVDLGAVADEVCNSLKVSPKFNHLNCLIDLRRNGENRVLADFNRVAQVLLNLILNAGQAGAKKVTVDCTVSSVISIWDDGPGIPPENQARIFEPFFTTKESGTGLGLATSYRVLESMGATVRVESPIPQHTPSGGACFTLQFSK